MESLKKRWYHVPAAIRKPVILAVGMLFIIASVFTAPLPGPGGIPVFLIGIAILSTEFAWAKRVRDWTITKVQRLGDWWRANKVIGTLVFAACFGAVVALSIFLYRTVMH